MRSDAPEPIRLPVDRTQALVRALWRLIVSVCLVGAALLPGLDWDLLWKTNRATALALAGLYLVLGVATVLLVVPAARWLALACWPAGLHIDISPDHIVLELGPFGRQAFDWSRIEMGVPESISEDLLDDMPDDSFLPFIRHPEIEEDLSRRIQRFVHIETERLTGLLRPYLEWAGSGHDEPREGGAPASRPFETD
ncbi:MAG: hypothetical protein ACE5E1_10740 [Phycisphaerae bacterium]